MMNTKAGETGETTQSLATTTLPSTSSEAVISLGEWRVGCFPPEVQFSGTILTPRQIHGGNIAAAAELKGQDLAADGVVVDEAGTMAGIVTSDCAPVVITSDRRALALHVSRKSLIHGLLDNALTYVSPVDINQIYIGPHICEYHFGFEEEGELVKRFRRRYPDAVHFHKGVEYLSLRKALRGIFSDWGVHPQRLREDGRCTFEHPTLPSTRRHKAAGFPGSPQGLKTVVWRSTSDRSA